jgi:ADP-heptose:LPS heptosyltransferase
MIDQSVWARARNILCVRLDAMGDVLMTTPAIRALKESAPGRRITLLTSVAGAAISPMLPEVDDCWIYESPWMKATVPRPYIRVDRKMIGRLRSGAFDAAVIFTVFSQNPLASALFCYLADIPLRLAYCRENPYQLLSEWIPDPEIGGATRHEVRRQLDLVAEVGAKPSHERLSLRRATTGYAVGEGNDLEWLGQVHMPHSLGILYEQVTAYLGFLHSCDEYKVMALASFGKPRFTAEFFDMIHVGPEG